MMHCRNHNHRFFFLCLVLCGMLCLFGCKKRAADDTPQTIEYAIDKPFYKGPLRVRICLGEKYIKLSNLLDMEVSTTIDPDYTIEFPAVAEAFKQFKVRSWKELPETISNGDKVVKTRRYQLEPLELGQCEIPAMTFTFKPKESSQDDTTEAETLTTEPLWIDVSTSLSADPNAMAIADIEDIVTLKANYTWLWIGMGIVGLLAAGVVVGLALKPKKAVQVRRIYKPAHEIAFEMLQAIAREKLVEQGHVKEFYEKLSSCLRQYIENRFQLRAPEQTTEEFLEQLKISDALKPEHKQQLQQFLEHCDLVKFARYQPNNEQINESLTMAEQFVDKTKSLEHRVDVTATPPAERQVAS